MGGTPFVLFVKEAEKVGKYLKVILHSHLQAIAESYILTSNPFLSHISKPTCTY